MMVRWLSRSHVNLLYAPFERFPPDSICSGGPLWFSRIRSILRINELGRSLQNVNSSCQKVKANRLTFDLNVQAISLNLLILRLIRFWLQTGGSTSPKAIPRRPAFLN